MRTKLLIFVTILSLFLIVEYQNQLKTAFFDYSYLLPILSSFVVILTYIIRARQITSLIANIKAKIFRNEKLEQKICKNEEIDKIQNILITNLEKRIEKIEKKLDKN